MRRVTITIELPNSYNEGDAATTEEALNNGTLEPQDLFDLSELDDEITVHYQVTDL